MQYLTEGICDNAETDTSDSSLYMKVRTGNRLANYYIATLIMVKEGQLPPSTAKRCLGGVEVKFRPFLTSALDGGELSISSPGHFNPEKNDGTH